MYRRILSNNVHEIEVFNSIRKLYFDRLLQFFLGISAILLSFNFWTLILI